MRLVTRIVLGSAALLLVGAAVSASKGLAGALAFVMTGEDEAGELPLPRPVQVALSVAPADFGFGFFAPQVCSEFKVAARVGSLADGSVRPVEFRFGPESQLLVGSLSSSAQDDEGARAIATSVASYSLSRTPESDSVEVSILAEDLPLLRDATKERSKWQLVKTYLFKR